jgi:glycosyltransferase involved in cell wall biosynthesis
VEAAVAAKLTGRRLVTKVVGDEVWDRASRLGWTQFPIDEFQDAPAGYAVRSLKALRRYALRASHSIIVPSRYTGGLVRRWVPDTPPVTVIPNAVEPKSTQTQFALKSELRTLAKLAFVGRLIPLKRVDMLLDLVAAMPDVGLVVAGDGPEQSALIRAAHNLGIDDRVQFTGAIDEESVWSLLSQCELLVLNSTTENCPHVVLEAMAVGLPVVATRVGGVPEIVKDGITGILVDAGKPAELKSAVAKLLSDPELRRNLGMAGKASIGRFSWPSAADAVASVLRQACTS